MQTIAEERDFNRLLINNFGKMLIFTFYADWFEHSVNYVEQLASLQEVSPLSLPAIFVKCDAEKVPNVANKFGVVQVPTIIVTESRSQILLKLENIPATNAMEQLEDAARNFKSNFEKEEIQLREKVKGLLDAPGILMFIKGTPQDPNCKFTRQLLDVVNGLNIKYRYYDIIADADMRHWLRYISKWPTYPQIFIDGKLLGGLDVLKDKIAKNELIIPQSAKETEPQERLKSILEENKAILLLEGEPGDDKLAEKNQKTIQALQETGIRFNIFNLGLDNKLNQHLSSQESTIPPVFFAGGKLVGNAQVILELAKKEELLQQVPGSEWRLDGAQKLKYLLKTCKILAFIKGTPKEPDTEESKELIKILEDNQIIYDFFNVEADADVSQSLKLLSTINTEQPQLYVKGELIGGIPEAKNIILEGKLKSL